MSAPTVTSVKRYLGVAGEYGYRATVQYPDEPGSVVAFQSSVYGPPIVMLTNGMPGGVFVSERVLDRIGRKLDESWVRAFFAPREDES